MSEAGGENDPRAGFSRVAASGAAWLALAQLARIAFSFLATIVIARLLSPEDFGVTAMVGPLLTLLTLFQDFGLSAATIQARTLSQAQSNALFWLNTGISAGLALLLLALSPLVTLFYGDARAGHVAAASAASLFLGSLGLQHSALLSRGMRFKVLGLIDLAGLFTTYTSTIVLALVLRNYWALFLGVLAGSLVQTVMWWRASGFRPSWPSMSGAGDLARMGGNVTGFNLLNLLVRNLDDVLVARVRGALEAGLYDRSYRLMMMPLNNINGPLNRLLQPILAKLQDEPVRFRRAFVLAVRVAMMAIAPAVAVAALLSYRLMPWLLGDRWQQSGAIFFWLGLAGLLQPVSNLTGLLFICTGRSRALLHWGVFSGVITIVAFAIGIRGGAVGIALALFVSLALRVPILFVWSSRGTPVRSLDLFAAQIEPLIGPLVVAAAALTFGGALPFLPLFVVAVLASYLTCLAVCLVLPASREMTIEILRLAAGHIHKVIGERRRGRLGSRT